MTGVVVFGGLAFTLAAIAAVWLWQDHLVQRELEDRHAFDAHVADALDLAFDPDYSDFRYWEEELTA
jgi:hypothetical protein